MQYTWSFLIGALLLSTMNGCNSIASAQSSQARSANTKPVTINIEDLQKPSSLPGLRSETGEPLSHSPFGLHAAGGATKFRPQLKVKYIRRIVFWNQIEPQKGNYQFRKADAGVRVVQNSGLDLVVTLRPVSRWGVNIDHAGLARRPKVLLNSVPDSILWSGYPHDLETWLTMVRTCVERYDGDGVNDMPGLKRPIIHWQIDNEIMWQWQSPMKDYVKLFNATAQEIKRANPEAKVILGAIDQSSGLAFGDGVGDMAYLWHGQKNPKKLTRQQVLATQRYQTYKRKADLVLKHSGPYSDIIDFHDYGQDAEDLVASVKWLNQETNRHGYQRPIWSLENAGPFFQFTPQKFSEEIVKRHVVGVSAGMSALFWSSLHPTTAWSKNFVRLSLLDVEGNPKPAFKTYMMLADALEGVKSISRVYDQDGVKVFLAEFDSQRKYIAWSEDIPRDVTLDLGETPRQFAATPIYWSGINNPPQTKTLSATGESINVRLSTIPVLLQAASN